MPLKPWYTVIPPREDLRSGKPLDAAEFAVHLDQVRDESAADVYRKPEQFFERTYLTQTLTLLGSQVLRRLSGERTETSAVFNLMTQFGGGKTHALTMLYHLAKNGDAANGWTGVNTLLARAGIASVPKAEVAVFVGTEFDSLTGRGGTDGTPIRRTPWGEIAYQLGGAEALTLLDEHERQLTAPAGDVIRKLLPENKPCLILMDELLNYVGRNRQSGLAGQLFSFIQNLSETARGMANVVLAISIPKSEMEMTPEDFDDYNRFGKLLDRVGKALMMSGESETSEIIRRRLFEWNLDAIGQHGRVQLPRDAMATCNEYADWVLNHRAQLPGEFPIDTARDAFAATYPLHPSVISVFERKWQSLPRFQRTRGVLRLLALWVSRSYQAGYANVHRDPLIDLGTAPLDDPLFRAAMFEQLGESKLEVPITTDIIGKKDAHAARLDAEAVDSIKKARLHRKVATAIFFESNGGMAQTYATLPEIRLAVAAPDLDVANVETVLEALVPPDGACYYLDTNRNRYWFSIKPNLTKLLADRKASVQPQRIDERVRAEIEKIFSPMTGIERVFFPTASSQIGNQPALTMVIMAPNMAPQDPGTLSRIDTMTRECGASARTYKSALIWVLAQSEASLREEVRKVLAWDAINDEKDDLPIDDAQRRQIDQNVKSAREDLRESVWRTYNHIAMLDKDNTIQVTDLGQVQSGVRSPIEFIINRLKTSDEILESVGPNFLLRNWPAFTEWSTRAVRDAFFASPKFPRLLNAGIVRDTIAAGVTNGFLAYVGKAADGSYKPFIYGERLQSSDVEISDDTFVITKDVADAYKAQLIAARQISTLTIVPAQATVKTGEQYQFAVRGADQHGNEIVVHNVAWSASAGMIGMTGLFVAGSEAGAVIITASVGGISSIAAVQVEQAPVKQINDGKDVQDNEDDLPPPAPAQPKRITWSGEIPAQRWMNFYTRILAKFATGKALKLNVSVEITPERGLSPQQIDEIKIGLRELGLDDNVRTE